MKGIVNLGLLVVGLAACIDVSGQTSATDNTKPAMVPDTATGLVIDASQPPIVDSSKLVKAVDTTAVPKPVVPPVRKVVPKKPKPFRTEFSGGIRLNTDGWSLFVDKGWVKSEEKDRDNFYDVKLFQVEFAEKKHPKEIKRNNNTPSDNNAKPFIFGKVNNFYTFKLGYGARKMIAGKPERGTVAIHWVYLGGLSAGLLKPYYLEAFKPDNTVSTIRYTDTTREQFLTPQNIIGSAGFAQGLGETKVIPGVHFKTALHFDFARAKNKKIAVETGINAELYTKKIEMMAFHSPVPYFVNFYASFQFGKRWQ
jgi:hypothetical protein